MFFLRQFNISKDQKLDLNLKSKTVGVSFKNNKNSSIFENVFKFLSQRSIKRGVMI